MGCRHGEAIARSDGQPRCGRHHGGNETKGNVSGKDLINHRVCEIHTENPFANGISNRITRKERPCEFKDSGDDHCLFECQGTGANRCTHRIRNIVCTNVPRHVGTDNQSQTNQDNR